MVTTITMCIDNKHGNDNNHVYWGKMCSYVSFSLLTLSTKTRSINQLYSLLPIGELVTRDVERHRRGTHSVLQPWTPWTPWFGWSGTIFQIPQFLTCFMSVWKFRESTDLQLCRNTLMLIFLLKSEEGCWFISQLFDLKQACKATVGLSWSAAELAKDKRNPCTDGCYLGSWSHGLYLLPRFHPGLVKFDFISVLIERPRQDKSENSKWGERTIEVGEKFDAVFSTSQIFRERHDLFSGDLEERPLSDCLSNLGIGSTISLSASRESQLLSGTRQIDHTQ